MQLTNPGAFRNSGLPKRVKYGIPNELSLGGTGPGLAACEESGEASSVRLPSRAQRAEAVALLAKLGEEAKILADGLSLVPMMNFRLARPTALVEVSRIDGLSYLRADAAGQAGADAAGGAGLRIGALTTHRAVETSRDPAVLHGFGVLPRSARWIGHYPIRSRGTFGGSIAHAGPASEWCLLAALLAARIVLTGPDGQRTVAAAERLRRPVRWTEDRQENLTAAFHGHEQRYRVKAAFSHDGRILGLDAEIDCDTGACSVFPFTCAVEPLMAATELPGVYKVPAYRARGRAIATNKAPAAPYRPDLAEQIVTENAWAAERDTLRRAGQRAGIGYACFSERTAYGTPTMSQRRMRMTPGYDTAMVRMDPTGEVIVSTNAVGATVANAVRDALGLPGGVGQLPLTPARVCALAALAQSTGGNA